MNHMQEQNTQPSVKEQVLREFKLTTFSINNTTSVFLLAILIIVMGVGAYISMPRESFPEIVQPTIYVGTTYPGNSPKDIENLVTRPLEKKITTIPGIKSLKSTSIQDYSTIIVEFNLDKNVKDALQEVKDKVDKAKKDLPNDDLLETDVFELDFSDIPVMYVNLYGEFGNEELRKYAEYLEEKMEKFPEVSEVEIQGLIEQEVNIDLDPLKMEYLQVTFRDIEDAMNQENMTMSGGDLLSDGFRRNVRIAGEFTDVSEMEGIIVKREGGSIVYLRDIANVSFGFKERDSYARMNGQPSVTLAIKKQSGENIVNAATKVKEVVDYAINKKFPKDLKVNITGDQSKQTFEMVASLENNIISGVILVTLVLFFFLGLRSALFVGVAIPMSMLMGIVILAVSGITLNMMVLFSLILALGMLVDNGIVTIENIYRLRSEGMSLKDASKYGAGEIAWPIISSTATTVAAFAPLLFWKDLMGEFMKYLPLTLIITLSSSLFVALVVNPALTAKYLKTDEDEKAPTKTTWKFWVFCGVSLVVGVIFMVNGRTKTLYGQTAIGTGLTTLAILAPLYRFVLKAMADYVMNVFLVKLENAYGRFLGFFLKGMRPVILFFSILILMVATQMWYFGSDPKVEFFPETDPRYLNVFIEMPIGTDIEDTDAMTKKVEAVVFDALKDDMDIVEAVLSQVGKGTADPMEGVDLGSNPHKARLNISFLEYQYRKGKSTWEIMEHIREKVREVPGAIITVDKDPTGPPVGYPINIEVSGEEYDQLIAVADKLKQQLEDLQVPGVEGLKIDLETGKPELNVYVDRENVRRYGISTAQVASEIRSALFGKEISKFKQGEDDYPIVVRYNPEARYDLSRILENKITYQNPSNGRFYQVPISAVASVEYASSFGSIKRLDMDRVITIYSNVLEGYNATEIVGQYKEYLSAISLPDGFTVKITGEQQEQEESSEFLMFAFIIALFLVFLIIVAQFNSVSSPFIIMFSVLFSTIGVFGGLATFNMPFVVMMTGIGIISLAGVVVNNAIVLIDYAKLLMSNRKAELDLPEDANLSGNELRQILVNTGKTRLRPVLLTAITTVLGLIPLAIGLNIDFIGLFTKHDPNFYIGGDNVAFWGPMSWTIIFGLTFATFLTLVVLPTMFLMVERGKVRLKKLFS